MARLAPQTSVPVPVLSQAGPLSGAQQDQPIPAPNLPDNNIGTQKKQANPHEKLIKSLLPATSDSYGPEVQGMSKALLQRLIPYL